MDICENCIHKDKDSNYCDIEIKNQFQQCINFSPKESEDK